MGSCADSSVGLEKHKAIGGTKLDVGHLVAGYLHAVIPGGFNIFGIYLRVGGGIVVDNAHTLSCLERAITRSHGEWLAGGDWNNDKESLLSFAEVVGGVIVAPPIPTCKAGLSESIIDYFIVSLGMGTKIQGFLV